MYEMGLQRSSQPLHVAMFNNRGIVSMKSLTLNVKGHLSCRLIFCPWAFYDRIELEGLTEGRSCNHGDQ